MKKETFILRTEWADAIMDLKDAEQAVILRNLFFYHKGDFESLKLTSPAVKLIWKLIEPNLKRNIEDYDRRRDTSGDNGKLGGRPRKEPNKPKSEPNNLIENLTEPNNPIVSVSVSDSVSVIEPVLDSNINKPGSGENFESGQPSSELPVEGPPPIAPPPSMFAGFPGKPTPADIPDPPEHIIESVQASHVRRGFGKPTQEQVLAHFRYEWRPVEMSKKKFYIGLGDVYGHYVNRCNTLNICENASQRTNTPGRPHAGGNKPTGGIIPKDRQYLGRL